MSARRWWAIVAALTAAGAALRLYGLGSQPLWEDEAQTYWIASQPFSTIPRLLARDCSPPLYYLMLHLWMGKDRPSERMLRLPSAVIGVATIPLLALAARRLGRNPWVGLSAGLLLAVSPLHVWHSQEARMYTLLAALALVSAWSLDTWLRGRHWLPFVFSTALALWTHHFALYLVSAELVWVVLRRPPKRWKPALLILVVLYLPVAWLLWFQAVVNQTGGWIGRPPWDAVLRTFGLLSLGVRADEQVVWRGVPWLVAAGAAAFIPAFVVGARWWARRAALPLWLTVSTPILAFVFSQFVASYTTGRYDMIVLPFYLMTVAGSSARPRRFILVAAAILAVEATPIVYYHSRYRKSASRQVAAEVLARERPNELVVIAPEIHFSPFKYYYQGLLRSIPLTEGAAGGVVDYSRYAERWVGAEVEQGLRTVEQAYRGGRIFLIWSPYKGTVLFKERLLERFRLADRAVYRTGSGYLELDVLELRDGGPRGEHSCVRGERRAHAPQS